MGLTQVAVVQMTSTPDVAQNLAQAEGLLERAAALGARVYKGDRPEVGLLPVELTPDASADPVFRAAPRRFTTLQWHGDTFDLPTGATRLAGSPAYPNQAFRVGRSYGIQFHFEADRRLVRQWNQDFATSIDRWHPDWPARFENEEVLHGPDADAAGLSIAQAWVKTI